MNSFFLKTVILFSIVVSSFLAHAASLSEQIPYYGKDFYQDLKAGANNFTLSSRLKVILKSYHSKQPEGLDTVAAECSGRCYMHTPIGYKNARLFLLANFYLIKAPNGYGVHDVYCDRDIAPEDFPRGNGAGPNLMPDDRVVNVEHTWPQSRFTGKYDTETQKSDLHHLFPTNSKTNSARGNNKFGEVARDMQKLACPNVRSGVAAGGNSEIFEPPLEHKGNVARALFYFSTRYDLPIDPNEEAFLRKWNEEDPVDEVEMKRNDEIFKVQLVRNPFIDYPELADRIDNF